MLDALFSYRLNLYQRKPYPQATAHRLYQDFEKQKAHLASGAVGVYLGVYPKFQGQQFIYPVLDIDGDKKNPASAIVRAQDLYTILRQQGLAQYARWGLSGTGLRCIFPFLISSELRPGFIRFLQNHKHLGIDASIFSSVDPPPVRVLCYRGHHRQKNVHDSLLDRHSVLIDTETLLSIETIDDYHHFTAGRPDPDEYLFWLKTILPVAAYETGNGAPPEIESFLQTMADLTIRAELSANIFEDFRFPHSRRRLDIQHILDHLDELGISCRERKSYFILSECPLCRAKGKAWLLRSGILRCFRQGCGASRDMGGLKPEDWLEIPLEYEEPIQQREPVCFVDLDHAERMILDHLKDAGTRDIGLAITPGTGKTRAAIAKAVQQAQSGVVVYAMPNHRLIDESIERIKIASDIPVVHYYGRRGKKKPITCLNYEKVEKAQNLGYYPANTVCLDCQYHPAKVRKRPYKSFPCPYYRQFEPLDAGRPEGARRKGLVFCTSHALPHLMMDDGLPKKSAFIDESSVQALVQVHGSIGLDALQTLKPFVCPDAQNVIERIVKVGELVQQETIAEGRKLARVYSAQPGGGQWEGKVDLWRVSGLTKDDARKILGPEISDLFLRPQISLFNEGINRNAILWLAAAVGSGVAWIHINTKSGQSHLYFQRIYRHTIPEDIPITVLDATTTLEELRALFQRDIDLKTVNVAWEGRRVWLHQFMGKKKTGVMKEQDIEKYLTPAVKHLPERLSYALLVTHQHVEERALDVLRRLRPDVMWYSTHYYASRGLNAFELAEAIICFGVPVGNPGAMTDIACALFYGDSAQQATWIQDQNEAELYQAIHRNRPVRNPGRTLIVMGHFWPEHLLGKPDSTEDRRHNQDSQNMRRMVERALPLIDTIGFFTKETAAWVGIGAKKDERKILDTRQAAKTIFGQIGSQQGLGGALSSISNIYIGLNAPEFDQFLLSANGKFWTLFLGELEKHRPGIGRLSVRLGTFGNRNFTHGLGTIGAAREWTMNLNQVLAQLGYDPPAFNEAGWREGWG